MRRLLLMIALLGGLFVAGPALTTVDACPMCKYANEDGTEDGGQVTKESLRPQAYMYSILFMISMPATLFAGFSIGFYRLSKKQQELMQVSIERPDDRLS